MIDRNEWPVVPSLADRRRVYEARLAEALRAERVKPDDLDRRTAHGVEVRGALNAYYRLREQQRRAA